MIIEGMYFFYLIGAIVLLAFAIVLYPTIKERSKKIK